MHGYNLSKIRCVVCAAALSLACPTWAKTATSRTHAKKKKLRSKLILRTHSSLLYRGRANGGSRLHMHTCLRFGGTRAPGHAYTGPCIPGNVREIHCKRLRKLHGNPHPPQRLSPTRLPSPQRDDARQSRGESVVPRSETSRYKMAAAVPVLHSQLEHVQPVPWLERRRSEQGCGEKVLGCVTLLQRRGAPKAPLRQVHQRT